MNPTTHKLSIRLKWAAFGACLTMLSLFFAIALIGCDIVSPYGHLTAIRNGAFFQLIGCIIWGVSLLSCSTPGKDLKIPSLGWKLSAAGAFLVAPFSLLLLFMPSLIYLPIDFILFIHSDGMFGYGVMEMDSVFLCTMFLSISLFIGINILLAIGTAILGKQIKIFNRTKISYIILAIFPISYFLICIPFLMIFESNLFLLLFAVIFLFIGVFLIISWWKAAANARKIEAEVLNASATPTPPEPTTSTATDVPPVLPNPNSITDAQRALLMGMSNQELNNVVMNASLYSDPTFVDEAKKIIAKRQAWEMIKDYSDEQLLSIIHENIQNFKFEVLDAASLELFNREAPAFVNEINALKTEDLIGIVNNPEANFDGYVRAATLVLSFRQNNPPQA